MDDRLRREDLADRCGDRRRAGLAADHDQLVEDVVEAVGGSVRAEPGVDRRDEARRQLVLGGAHRDSRRERGHGIVADELVDHLGGLPEDADVDSTVHAGACERARGRFARDTVQRERDRIDGTGDQVRSGTRSVERCGQPAPGRPLAIEADGQAASLGERRDELVRPVRLERSGRIVEEHARGSEVGQPLRLLDERLRLAALARAVDQARVELALRRDDRLARLTQVRDVVERILEPEDVDAALGRARDESPREVAADGARADEEAAAERHPERRLRAGFQRTDPLPGALDAAPDRRVEDTPSGNLEIREAGAVENLGEPEQVGGRDPPGQRFLAEQADRRIDERRHPERVTRPRPARCTGLRAGRP